MARGGAVAALLIGACLSPAVANDYYANRCRPSHARPDFADAGEWQDCCALGGHGHCAPQEGSCDQHEQCSDGNFCGWKGTCGSWPTTPADARCCIPGGCKDTQITKFMHISQYTGQEAVVCHDRLNEIHRFASEAVEFLANVNRMGSLAHSASARGNTFVTNMNKIGAFAFRLPKVGPPVKAMVKGTEKVVDKLATLAKWRENALWGEPGTKVARLKSSLEELVTRLDSAKDAAKTVETNAFRAKSRCGAALGCMQFHECAGRGALNRHLGSHAEWMKVVHGIMQSCGTELDVALPSIDIDLSLEVFEKVRDFFAKVDAYIQKLVGDAIEKADAEICCNQFLQDVFNFFGEAGAAFNLATCFVDAAVNEGVAAILDEVTKPLGALEAAINKPIYAINTKLSALEAATQWGASYERTFPLLALPPCIDYPQWTMSVNIALGGDFGSLPYVDITSGGDGIANLGNAIKDACSDALAALTDDPVPCCDQARTCSPEHHILMYEGNGCTQYVAGTLDHHGGPAMVANDHACLPNDEARSLKFVGPLEKGVTVHLGDHYNDWCLDDYAMVVLTQDLKLGEEVCVTSFEERRGVRLGNGYTLFNNYETNLDGKVSRFDVDDVAYTSDYDHMSHLRCPFASVRFFEDNGCPAASPVRTATVPASGGSAYHTVSGVPNDWVRSVGLAGPVKAGYYLRLSDDSRETGNDDVASIVVESDIPSGEFVCVSTLESSTTYGGRVRVEYHPRSNLDGKVSKIKHYLPARATDYTHVLARLDWTNRYSEETGGNGHASDRALMPIHGFECSGRYCDNKRYLQAEGSVCQGSTGYWTGKLSETRTITNCKSGYYVADIGCNGSFCKSPNIYCRRLSGCSFTGSSVVEYVNEDTLKYFRPSYAAFGVACYDKKCKHFIFNTQRLQQD